MDPLPIDQHNIEIQQNLNYWKNKPVLQEIYRNFYRLIGSHVDYAIGGKIVELGSGIGNIKLEIPQAVCTDLFRNPWIDQVENAYSLSFRDEEVSNLILFDVFHHLQYPGTALSEFKRVLKPGGRVIIFDPSISALGFLVFGIFHHEPIGWFRKIHWNAPSDFDPRSAAYYAAQGNAEKVFFSKKYKGCMADWRVISRMKLPALSYVLSGGYSKPQLFSSVNKGTIDKIEKVLMHLPGLFSTRALIVLQKKQ
jgi:SAM-dependent methyltransferase